MFKYLGALTETASLIVLIASSFAFLGLFIFNLIFLGWGVTEVYGLNAIYVAWGIVVVLFRILPLLFRNYKWENSSVFFVSGSISFLVFFLSGWLLPYSSWGRLYNALSGSMESILSEGFVSVIITFMILPLTLAVLDYLSKMTDYIEKKYITNEMSRKVWDKGWAWVYILVFAASLVLTYLSGEGHLWGPGKYLAGLLGVSLIFLHGGYLLRTVAGHWTDFLISRREKPV